MAETANAYIRQVMTGAQDPYEMGKWAQQTVRLGNGERVMTVPNSWHQPAVLALAKIARSEETDARQIIDRIVNIITKVGFERGYFLSEAEADAFHAELKYLLVTQRVTFSHEVWQSLGENNGVSETVQGNDRTVQVSDLFMRAIEADGEWRAQEEPKQEGKARHIWQDIVRDVWKYGDIALQFSTIHDDLAVIKTLQHDTTAPKADIRVSAYVQKDGSIDVVTLKQSATITYTALDIITQCFEVSTPEELEVLRYYRPISLGLTDVSSVLFALGLAYDSDEGREVVRSLYAIVNGQAVLSSIHYAELLGAFVGYDRHKLAVGRILRAQRDAIVAHQSHELSAVAKELWAQVVDQYRNIGMRNVRIGGLHADEFMQALLGSENAHVSPLQRLTQEVEIPTGGKVKIVKEAATQALRKLQYSADEISTITSVIHDHPAKLKSALHEEHQGIFAIASKYIEPQTFEMLAVITPFVGLGIAAPLLLPKETTPRDIEKMLVTAWQLGLPQVHLQREEATLRAPEVVVPEEIEEGEEEQELVVEASEKPKIKMREELPRVRTSKTFAFCIDGTQCYLTVSEGENSAPLELLVNIQHNHAQLVSVLNAWAQSVNVGLQHGVALSTYIKLALDTEFGPAGKTDDEEIPLAHSILDYIARRLALYYLTNDQREAIGINVPTVEVHKDQVRLLG